MNNLHIIIYHIYQASKLKLASSAGLGMDAGPRVGAEKDQNEYRSKMNGLHLKIRVHQHELVWIPIHQSHLNRIEMINILIMVSPSQANAR